MFPTPEYFACIRDVLRRADAPRLLSYADPGGQASFIEALRVYLRRMRGVSEGEVVVAHGSQEAIFLIGQMLLQPGDTVAVEPLGYRPAWEALRACGGRLEGLPLDEDGVLPEALDRLARRRRVRLVYVTPLHQYPTSVTMPAPRRAALYEIAARHGIPILEDDYDHEFHYRSHPVPPLQSHDPEGLVVYVSTFSKVLYPAARLGFAVVPPALARALRGLKAIVSRQNDTLVQEAVARWMALGGFERHLRRMRRAYAQRMEAMLGALEAACAARGVPLQVRRPDGGMSLWVSLGVPSDALAEEAAKRGVGIQSGRRHMLRAGAIAYQRLGFASATVEEIHVGVGRLVEAAAAIRRG